MSPSQETAMVMGPPGTNNNPFKFIEAALNEAKLKIEKMSKTPQILESLPDDEKKKKFLRAENKLLRENLKRMSDNVNVLIEKMNQESLKKRNLGGNKRRAAAAVGGDGGAPTGGVSNVGGATSAQGDVYGAGNVTLDEEGRPVQGGVGVGLVPGNLPNRGVGGSVAGKSGAGQSMRGGKHGSPDRGHNLTRAANGHYVVGERELANTDKAIVNLMKEHNKLKKRLEMI